MFLFYVFFVVILLCIACGYYFASKVIYKPIKTDETILAYESQNKVFDFNWFRSLDKEKVLLHSAYGYTLSGVYLPSGAKNRKTIICSHGITVNYISSLKYARMFYNQGWNVFLYDHRRHGNSGGKTTTYGFFEKQDLKRVVDYIRDREGKGSIIGIHGESMGAAIMLQYAGMEDGADFYIADCAYASLQGQLTYLLKRDYHLPAFPFIPLADFFVFHMGKFHLREVNPLEDVKKIQKPVLFIHGAEDRYVPTPMCKELFVAKNGYKDLYLVAGAGHACSLQEDPEKYQSVVLSFIDKALPIRRFM